MQILSLFRTYKNTRHDAIPIVIRHTSLIKKCQAPPTSNVAELSGAASCKPVRVEEKKRRTAVDENQGPTSHLESSLGSWVPHGIRWLRIVSVNLQVISSRGPFSAEEVHFGCFDCDLGPNPRFWNVSQYPPFWLVKMCKNPGFG